MKITNEEISETLEQQKDFYKSELIKMGFYKTVEGKQLYELSLYELRKIYWSMGEEKNE